MEIILMRHGCPNIAHTPAISLHAHGAWVSAYEKSGVLPDHVSRAVPSSHQPMVVIVSDLQRAIDSARIVCPGAAPIVNPDLRELPVPPLRAPTWFPGWLRLNPHLWTALLRVVWFCGWSGGGEKRSDAIDRVQRAVDAVVAQAETGARVLVVAHGLANLFIARELRRRGWRGPRIPGSRHWSCTRYQSP